MIKKAFDLYSRRFLTVKFANILLSYRYFSLYLSSVNAGEQGQNLSYTYRREGENVSFKTLKKS